MTSLVRSGARQCIDLVGQVCRCYRSSPKEAQENLEVIKKCIPHLIAELKRKEENYERRRDEMQATEASLEHQINSKEAEKKNLEKRIDNIKVRKKIREKQIDERKKELENAKTEKEQAEQHHKQVTDAVKIGAVGAGILGIFWPPTLIVTLPTVAAVGTGLRSATSKIIDDHQNSIDNIKLGISNDEWQIKLFNTSIRILNGDIVDLQSRLQCLYSNREQLRNVIVFMQRAICYFGEMQVAVEAGKRRTDLLCKVLKVMNMKQEYKIKSKGHTTIVNSFADAWSKVVDGLISGKETGFLTEFNIEFDNSFDPHAAIIEMQQDHSLQSIIKGQSTLIIMTVCAILIGVLFGILFG